MSANSVDDRIKPVLEGYFDGAGNPQVRRRYVGTIAQRDTLLAEGKIVAGDEFEDVTTGARARRTASGWADLGIGDGMYPDNAVPGSSNPTNTITFIGVNNTKQTETLNDGLVYGRADIVVTPVGISTELSSQLYALVVFGAENLQSADDFLGTGTTLPSGQFQEAIMVPINVPMAVRLGGVFAVVNTIKRVDVRTPSVLAAATLNVQVHLS